MGGRSARMGGQDTGMGGHNARMGDQDAGLGGAQCKDGGQGGRTQGWGARCRDGGGTMQGWGACRDGVHDAGPEGGHKAGGAHRDGGTQGWGTTKGWGGAHAGLSCPPRSNAAGPGWAARPPAHPPPAQPICTASSAVRLPRSAMSEELREHRRLLPTPARSSAFCATPTPSPQPHGAPLLPRGAAHLPLRTDRCGGSAPPKPNLRPP